LSREEDDEGSTAKGSQQGRRPNKGTSLAKSLWEEEGKRGGSAIGGSQGRGSHQGRLPSGSAPGVAWSIRRAGGAMCQVGRASEVERGSSARRLDRARGGSDRSSNKERALGLAWFWTGAEK
jgi:hypothetical protein